MATRVVEWKKPYTWGKAISIDENKVISLNLRDENNLIIYDAWDDEIYVDLQLPDEIEPTDAFPVWITTGRVIVDNGWDTAGTIICAKTTSGDNIKLLYADDGKLYIDNGTWTFKQIYLKGEVDALLQSLRNYVDTELAKKQDKLIAWENITIGADGKTISATTPPMSRFLSLWNCATGQPVTFPGDIPFEYITWDHFLVENVSSATPPVNYRPNGNSYTGTASSTVETGTVAVGDVYIYDGTVWLLQKNTNDVVSFSQIAGQPTDNTNLATALNAKQNTLTAWTNIEINSNTISAKWLTILSYWSSTWTDFINAYNDWRVVFAKASSNTNPWTWTQWRMAFMAFINFSGTTPTSVEFQYYRSVSSKSASQQTDQVFVYTLSNNGTWTVTTREAGTEMATGTWLSSSYNNWTLTLSNSWVTSVNGNTWAVTVSEFSPSWTATTGYVVTKTNNGYERQAPTGWIQLAPNSPKNIKYHRYWTQSAYDGLSQYYTDTTDDTAYFTI